MKISNQKPVVLNPVYNDSVQKPFDPIGLLKSTLVTPLFTPMIASQPVSIVDNAGHAIDEDDVATALTNCCGDVFNNAAEDTMKELLSNCLINYNPKTNIGAAELFVVQAATMAQLPEPNNMVVYTPAADVIPTSRQFMAGTCTFETWFASLAYYARPETLGFYFINEVAFTNFITWFQQQMAMLGSTLPTDTNKLASDFMQLTLPNLTESIVLRNNDTDNNDPLSFARLIVHMLMQYTSIAGPGEYGVLPFHVGELICPKTLVFVNVERHARATSKQVADEWKLIQNVLQPNMRPKVISNNKLQKLTATQRNLQKIASAAANAAMHGGGAMRAARLQFKKTRPTTVDVTRIIKKILDKMTFTNKSMNIYRSVRPSFAKPNRRDPDDYNKQGKVVSTKYKPDIHLYIDTSGSISERDYQDAVKACIAMAKKLNINMYFNSFSHVMSQTTKLNMQGKSTAQIYAEFQKVPKVTGGTDYEQIWNFINCSPKRRRELSIIISDFEWTARNTFVKHPKNLYYVPCSTIDWQTILHYAEAFCKSALHNDPTIRSHVLF